MLDILQLIPGKKRNTPSGWIVFNAPCCEHRGHKPDRKQRGGVKLTNGEQGLWSYHCFNCQFKAYATIGKPLSSNSKRLLEWLGLDRLEVERVSFRYQMNRDYTDVEEDYRPIIVSFDARELPEGSVQLDETNPEHRVHVDYLLKRGLTPQSYKFYITPQATGRESERIIIPYYYNGRIVGYTSRFYDNAHPKYLSEQQRGYVFNTDNQLEDWASCIVVEGQFDAIAIGGCAVMGATISDEQAKVLKKLRKNIIVVPDRDSSGMKICDRALELGYQVSIPDWSPEVKDVNDAVRRYGRFQTLLTILQAATSSKIITEIKKKEFK
jgi:hypothetical protein